MVTRLGLCVKVGLGVKLGVTVGSAVTLLSSKGSSINLLRVYRRVSNVAPDVLVEKEIRNNTTSFIVWLHGDDGVRINVVALGALLLIVLSLFSSALLRFIMPLSVFNYTLYIKHKNSLYWSINSSTGWSCCCRDDTRNLV